MSPPKTNGSLSVSEATRFTRVYRMLENTVNTSRSEPVHPWDNFVAEIRTLTTAMDMLRIQLTCDARVVTQNILVLPTL